MNEKQICSLICDYLSQFKNGFVIKHELSGKPMKRGNFLFLAPFKNKYYRRGISDVEFLYLGKTMYFEVKRPSELKWWLKKRISVMAMPRKLMNKKELHFFEQQTFIDAVNKTGNKADFVSSLSDVQKILKEFYQGELF